MIKRYTLFSLSSLLFYSSIFSMGDDWWPKRPSSYSPYGHFKCIVHERFYEPISPLYTYLCNENFVYSKQPFLTHNEIKLIYEKAYKANMPTEIKIVDKIAAMRFFADKFANVIDTISLPIELKEVLIHISSVPFNKPSIDASLKTRAALTYMQYQRDAIFKDLLKKYEHLDHDTLMNFIIESLSAVEGDTNKKFWILDKKDTMPLEIDNEFKGISYYPIALRQLYDKALVYQKQAMQKEG